MSSKSDGLWRSWIKTAFMLLLGGYREVFMTNIILRFAATIEIFIILIHSLKNEQENKFWNAL